MSWPYAVISLTVVVSQEDVKNISIDIFIPNMRESRAQIL